MLFTASRPALDSKIPFIGIVSMPPDPAVCSQLCYITESSGLLVTMFLLHHSTFVKSIPFV
jgi:hypothetical protein